MVGEDDKREKLQALADAVKELKQQHYLGTYNIYRYLKENGKYWDICVKIGQELRKKGLPSKAPGIPELNMLEQATRVTIDSFFAKEYGVDGSWYLITEKRPKRQFNDLQKKIRSWLESNFADFCTDYYVEAAKHDKTEQNTVFAETIATRLGKEAYVFALDNANWLNEPTTPLETIIFDAEDTFARLSNDRILHRDDYQRMLISEWIPQCTDDFGVNPSKNFEELIERVRAWYGGAKQAEEISPVSLDKGEQAHHNMYFAKPDEFYPYLITILHRHRSFVEKMLKEYNSEE